MSDDEYRTVSAVVHQIRPNSIMVEVPNKPGWHAIGRGLLHGADAIRLDRLPRQEMGAEQTFRVMEWKAEEMGLAG